jgi:hypothetical protein
LILYKELKAIYIALAPGVDAEADWTTYFQSQIGRFIMLMFNGDSRKEVNTSYRLRTLPNFFTPQYWAPYLSHEEGVFTKPLSECTLFSEKWRHKYDDIPVQVYPHRLTQIDWLLQALRISRVLHNSK